MGFWSKLFGAAKEEPQRATRGQASRHGKSTPMYQEAAIRKTTRLADKYAGSNADIREDYRHQLQAMLDYVVCHHKLYADSNTLTGGIRRALSPVPTPLGPMTIRTPKPNPPRDRASEQSVLRRQTIVLDSPRFASPTSRRSPAPSTLTALASHQVSQDIVAEVMGGLRPRQSPVSMTSGSMVIRASKPKPPGSADVVTRIPAQAARPLPDNAHPSLGDAHDAPGGSVDLGDVLFGLTQEYGDALMDDAARVNAFLMDCAPRMAKERRLIVSAIKEGVFKLMKRGLLEFHNDLPSVADRCVRMLVDELWVAEPAARYAVGVFSKALGCGAGGTSDRR